MSVLNLKLGQNILAMPANDLGSGWAHEYSMPHFVALPPVYGGVSYASALASQGFDHVRIVMLPTLMWPDPANPFFLPEADTYAGSPITRLFNEIEYWLDAGFSVILDPHVENVTVLDWGRPNGWGLVGENPFLNGPGTLPVGYQYADTGVRAAVMSNTGAASPRGRTRGGFAIWLREMVRKIALRFAGKSIAISGFNEPYIGSLFANPYAAVATSGTSVGAPPNAYESANTYNLNFPQSGANLWMAWQVAYMREFYNNIWLPETLKIIEDARFTLVVDVYCPWGFFAGQLLFDPRGSGFNGSVISELHMYGPFALTHQDTAASVTYSPRLGWPYATQNDMLSAACVGTGGTWNGSSCSTNTAAYNNASLGTFGRDWNPTGIAAILNIHKAAAGSYQCWLGEMGLINPLNNTSKLAWMDDVGDWCVANNVGRCIWAKSSSFGILTDSGQVDAPFSTHTSILPSQGTSTSF